MLIVNLILILNYIKTSRNNVTKIERIQKEYEIRLARQRKNRDNWPGMIMTTKTERSIQEANDVLFEGRFYKPTKKNGKKFV